MLTNTPTVSLTLRYDPFALSSNPLAPKAQRRLKNWIKWRCLAKEKSRNVYGQNNVRAVVPGCVDIANLPNTGQSESSTKII